MALLILISGHFYYLEQKKEFLKDENYSEKKAKKIKDRFKKAAKKDSRIISVGKKYYIDLSKYDYSDLLH